VCVINNPQGLFSSFLPSFLLSQYTWESVPLTYTRKSVSLGEKPQELSPTFPLCIHRKLYLTYIIHQDLMLTTLFDLLWQKKKKRVDLSHRYVIPELGGYIWQQLEHFKSAILQHNIGMILERRKKKQRLLYSPRLPCQAYVPLLDWGEFDATWQGALHWTFFKHLPGTWEQILRTLHMPCCWAFQLKPSFWSAAS